MLASATDCGVKGYRRFASAVRPARIFLRGRIGRSLVPTVAIALLATARPSFANTAPTAGAVTVLTTPATATAVTLSASDVDGDALSYVVVTLPSSGSVAVGSTVLASGDLPYAIPDSGHTVTYTAASTTHGAMTFTYKANDGTVDSSAATVTVNVNNAPSGTAATSIIPLNKDAKITLAGTDPDSDTLSYTILSVPGHGVLAFGKTAITASTVPLTLDSGKKEVTYTPDTGYHGPDTFTFKVADTWEASEAATQTIQVNTKPTLTSFTIYVPPNGTKTVTLRGSDADRDPISYIILSVPAHGTLSAGGQEITTDALPYTLADYASSVQYAPVAGYAGTDSFHYEVTDEIESSALGIVSVAINAPPVGSDTAVVADSAGAATALLAPTDADGDTLQVTIASLPAHGDISIGGNTVTDTTKAYSVASTGLAVSYQAGTGYAGTDVFTWQVSDAKDTAGPYTVSVSIPIAVPATPSAPSTPGSNSQTPTTPSTDTSTGTDTSADNSSGTSSGDQSSTDTGSSTDLSSVDFDPCGALGGAEAATLTALVTAGMLSGGFRRRRNASGPPGV
jgi:hypothetical protein